MGLQGIQIEPSHEDEGGKGALTDEVPGSRPDLARMNPNLI
jgi:hypothetical protein